jgi:starch phosphorylase
MARLTPLFSADRAVREYTEQHYLPAATALRSRVANKGASGRQMVDWQHSLEQKWGALRFGEVKVETKGQQHIFDVQVYLNDLDPKALQVELYADAINGGSPARQEMKPFARWSALRAATTIARLCLRPARQGTIRRE